jgi:uncharacterized protein
MTNNNNVNDSVDVQVLHSILVNLVTVPNEIQIKREIDELGVLISVQVNSQDMGIIIGRNGGMAMAIKTLMRAIGKSHKMSIRVQFLEPDGSKKYSADTQNTTKEAAVSDLGEFALN